MNTDKGQPSGPVSHQTLFEFRVLVSTKMNLLHEATIERIISDVVHIKITGVQQGYFKILTMLTNQGVEKQILYPDRLFLDGFSPSLAIAPFAARPWLPQRSVLCILRLHK